MDAESENSLTIRESDLYPWVRKFIKNKFKCFNKKLGEVGKEGIGYVDVFGVYYKDSKNTEIETVGVEVKPKKRRIAAEFGQAKGYSVFCHKVYFASMDRFDEIDKGIAKHLGIGLIEITKNASRFYCRIVCEPKPKNPVPELLEEILKRIKILRCDNCRKIGQRDYTKTKYGIDKISKWTKDQIKKGKDLLTSKNFYCNACAKRLLQIE